MLDGIDDAAPRLTQHSRRRKHRLKLSNPRGDSHHHEQDVNLTLRIDRADGLPQVVPTIRLAQRRNNDPDAHEVSTSTRDSGSTATLAV